METRIDIQRTRELTSIITGRSPRPDRFKLKMQEMAKKRKPHLFYYSLWSFIKDGQARNNITEGEVRNLLTQYPGSELKIYYCRLLKSSDRTPEILANRKIEKIEIGSYSELAELIRLKTSVSISETDLMLPQSKAGNDKWKNKPLHQRIRNFNADIAKAKRDKETRDRILACLQEADTRKRNECLRNCRTK